MTAWATPFGDIGFLQPGFLAALILLPILWWLLRAVPPAPKRERFPGVRILLGLEDRERTPDRTPWWLLLLRMVALAALIGAFAEPILNPKARVAGEGPLLIVMDGGWGSAPDWAARRDAALDLVDQARDAERLVALEVLSDPTPAPENLEYLAAEVQARRLAALEPAPWRPDPARLMAAVAAADGVDAVWFHDGLRHDPSISTTGDRAQDAADGAANDPQSELAAALLAKGPLRLIGPEVPPRGLTPPEISGGALIATASRPVASGEETLRVAAFGTDSAGAQRRLSATTQTFAPDGTRAEIEITLPIELRNALQRLEIEGARHAGGTALLDDRWRRRSVALVSGERDRNGQPLLSGMHYVRAALAPFAEYRDATLVTALGGDPETGLPAPNLFDAEDATPVWANSWADVIILSDIGRLDAETKGALVGWVEAGGLLVRFAGPQLAAATAEDGRISARFGVRSPLEEEDPLMPTRLRGGGRALGGALSWAAPQQLQPFPEHSPFRGLALPDEVSVSRQVLAEPGPELSGRTWASLDDGTPLVTSKPVGDGRVVLFHVTANSRWSSLPLSGLFVEMMGRLVEVAPGLAASASSLAEEAAIWKPEATMDAFGRVAPAAAEAAPVDGEVLAKGVGIGVPPGIYVSEGAEAPRRLAVSALKPEETVAPRPAPPSGAVSDTLSSDGETPLKPLLLAMGLALLLVDVVAALALAGGLRAAAAMLLAVGLVVGADGLAPTPTYAQTAPSAPSEAETATGAPDELIDPAERRAALETVLGYIVTGDERADAVSEAGLLGLSVRLFERTAIEPGLPAAVDLEADEISPYAVLYWPITRRQEDLSDAAVRKLNAFMRTGGLLVVDTRDAHQTFGAGEGPNANDLRRLAGRLDLPPLGPAPRDHILTRSFYLLDEMPGRWSGGQVWVEARAATDGGDGAVYSEERLNANDGVSPIIIGAADWASAWAIDDQGQPIFPMGRNGERQREMAWRFGINMAMYAFTGNYKSDQVHIPALLDRLGN